MHRRLGCDERSASGAVRASSSFEILNPRPFGLLPVLSMMIRISVRRITSLLVQRRRGLRSWTGCRNTSGACRPPPNHSLGPTKPHAKYDVPRKRCHASIRCFPSWCKSSQREDARAEGLLREGRIQQRQDSIVEWQRRFRRSRVNRADARTQGGGCNGGSPWSLFLHDSAAN